MALNEKQQAFRQRVLEYASKWLDNDNLSGGEITKESLDGLINICHYDHILQLMGDSESKNRIMYYAYAVAKERFEKSKDRSIQQTALIKLNLVAGHTSAWNIAHFHYERAIKTLCMMMVTLMDYIIQEQGGESVLYSNLDKTKYFDLIEEMTALNNDYICDYISICAFDFCSKKLGEYVDIPEYADIAREHERVINNGNPKRVKLVMNRLKAICSDNRRSVFMKIEQTYTPEPLYSEEIFEDCYRRALSKFDSEEHAMADFNSLVAKVSVFYSIVINAS